jgi:D-aminopeptidase
MTDIAAIERAVASIGSAFPGPGGSVGVVSNGRILLKRAWGYADAARRRPMTERTLMPICSISKQFTCGVLLDLFGDPEVFDERVADFLPRLAGRPPTTQQFCDMQSGLRDYWALTVLHGAEPEQPFRREDARPLLARMRTTHFEPGTSYSYSNGNFRVLADLIEERAGRGLGELYAERLFGPAGMETARLTADTSAPAGGTVGYEGNVRVGYFPATNRIFWIGDAGISASLDDMLAWECFIDATRDDADGVYRRLSTPPSFADGTPAQYGFGLVHETIGDVAVTGHGGALRGFRLQRLYAPAARLSVVVLFNHEADAHAAATKVMKAGLGQSGEPARGVADEDWAGDYVDPATDLLLRVERKDGSLETRFGGIPDTLTVGSDGVAGCPDMTLAREGDGLRVERPGERLSTVAVPVSGEARADWAGLYRSDETGGTFEIVDTAGALHGGFEGLLGKGPMQPLYPVGEDVWVLPCQRSMDAPSPGEWAIRVRREGGAVRGLTVGCWLARQVEYSAAG